MAKRQTGQQPAHIKFEPKVADDPQARKVLREFARELARACRAADAATAAEGVRREYLSQRTSWDKTWRDKMVAVVNVLADLARTGWGIEVGRSAVIVRRPPEDLLEDQRARHRRNLIGARAMQLREPSVQGFVREMERPRHRPGGSPVSIYSLMRDGRSLAQALQAVAASGREALPRLTAAVSPYVVAVGDDSVCEHTGLRLMDVWRYFRHTWTNPYQSVPGRSMNFLVRDAAAPNHPVMGIGAISSAAVQVTSRDRFIGWQAETFVAAVRADPRDEVAQWVDRSIAAFIGEIYLTDFLQEEKFTLAELRRPSDELIAALDEEAKSAKGQHRANMQAGEYKTGARRGEDEDDHWERQARLPLFRSKRADELASLPKLRRIIDAAFGGAADAAGLRRLLADADGRAALGSIVRKAKAKTVGVCIADLTVCGAVAPYNEILGGKLVAMLAASPPLVAEYRRRYASAPSVIASSMAGKAIRRRAELVFLATTSLYGVRPSQYDNISVPCERIGGKAGEKVRYIYLENTQGKGSFHFSGTTVEALAHVLRQSNKGLTVNSVFGEGANPKLRKVREGLECLGLPVEELITHGIDKLVYAVPLARNARDFLIGLAPDPAYLFSLQAPEQATQAIGKWWAERWVLGRLDRPETFQRLAQHSLALPIRHGARVILPDDEVDSPPLFDWST